MNRHVKVEEAYSRKRPTLIDNWRTATFRRIGCQVRSPAKDDDWYFLNFLNLPNLGYLLTSWPTDLNKPSCPKLPANHCAFRITITCHQYWLSLVVIIDEDYQSDWNQLGLTTAKCSCPPPTNRHSAANYLLQLQQARESLCHFPCLWAPWTYWPSLRLR